MSPKQQAAIRHETLNRLARSTTLTRIAKLVGAELHRCANNATARAWPSQQLLAKRLGCSDRWIKKAIRELKAEGWITVRFDGHSNVYRVHFVDERSYLGGTITTDRRRQNRKGNGNYSSPRTSPRKNTPLYSELRAAWKPLTDTEQEALDRLRGLNTQETLQ
jgi:DNA-binding transcriptional MocR family regulator